MSLPDISSVIYFRTEKDHDENKFSEKNIPYTDYKFGQGNKSKKKRWLRSDNIENIFQAILNNDR